MLEGEEIVADGERVIITEEEDEDGMGIVTTLRITKVSSFTKVSIKGGGARGAFAPTGISRFSNFN